jgi:hypothetical protein
MTSELTVFTAIFRRMYSNSTHYHVSATNSVPIFKRASKTYEMNDYCYLTIIYLVIRQELVSYRDIKNEFVHTITTIAILFLGFAFFLLLIFTHDYRPCLRYGDVPNSFHTTTDYADYSYVSSSKITFRDRLILRFLFRCDKFMAFD